MNINLIFGNRKSGTTLLARLIDNDQIYVGSSETNFHHLDKVKSLANHNQFTDKDVEKYFTYKLHSDEIALDGDIFKKIIKDKVSSVDSYYDFITLHVRALVEASNYNVNNKTVFFIKNVGIEPKIAFSNFLEAFPESKIISITRDPRFILRAIINDRKKHDRQLRLGQKFRYAFEVHRSVKQQKALKENSKIYTLSYEDLLNNHIQEVQKIFQFFKLPFSTKNEVITIYGEKTNTATHSKNAKKGEVSFSSPRLYNDISVVDFLIVSFSKFIYVIIGIYIFLKDFLKK